MGPGAVSFSAPSAIAAVSLGAAVADIDGDGDLDVISVGPLQWNENTGGGAFGTAIPIPNSTSASILVVADLDGDGDHDLITGSSGVDTVACHENLGGTFGPSTVVSAGVLGVGDVEALDVDGDGDLDVVAVATAADRVVLFENLGGLSFGPERVLSTSVQSPVCLSLADVNGDGWDDVVVASSDDGEVGTFVHTPAGFFSPKVPLACVEYPTFVHAADLDDDGDQDAVVVYDVGKVLVYENPAPISATTALYGVGCGPPPSVAFTPTAPPLLGQALTGQIANAPTTVGAVAMGWSKAYLPSGSALPVDLAALGMAGCELLQSSELLGLPAYYLGQAGQLHFSVPLPPGAAGLLGRHVYTQAYVYAPGVNATPFVVSNGIDWRIGSH